MLTVAKRSGALVKGRLERLVPLLWRSRRRIATVYVHVRECGERAGL